MRQWRLIYDQPALGARNMAVDEAILQAVSAGDALPTLRLYRWDPFCLSLGYAQAEADLDTARLAAYGWHTVRRPTGGRAILHGDELTYSVTVPMDHPLAEGDILESYRTISIGLLDALKMLGAQPQSELHPESQQVVKGPVCFEVPSHYEITSSSRKLIGSAQVRRSRGILQHGSLPLYGDVARICDVLRFDTEGQRETARDRVRERAITLEDAVGRRIEWEEAAAAVAAAFAQRFSLNWQESGLSASEEARAAQLETEQYSSPAWQHKR